MAIELNDEQRMVVEHEKPKILSIEAGPGAGKTRVLIEKVKHMIENGVKPETLLIITFSNKAAQELQERLADGISPVDVQKMQISTIHSFCMKILEDNGGIGYDVISDEGGDKQFLFISKHMDELGFVDEYYIPKSQINDVIRKYNEYCTFVVDSDKLVEYIEENWPVEEEYVEYVRHYMEEHDGKFPRKEIKQQPFKQSYYNARYLQIARSYPTYLEILKRENAIDFGQMQLKALELLESGYETQYTNILVDEFQDTDPIQYSIFHKLIEHAESFTVVGDLNQRIYGFRGSTGNYFEKLERDYPDDIKSLNLSVNHRSTYEVIESSHDLIKNQRMDHSKLPQAKCWRDRHNPLYYLTSRNIEEEAHNILEIIMHLKDTGKVKNYSDIGILLRSVVTSSCLNKLTVLFDENDISYQVRGLADLIDQDEIKSVLTLMHHLVYVDDPDSTFVPVLAADWLDLKAYTGENFNQVLFDLSDETKEILNRVQDDFEALVVRTENEVWKEMGKRGGKKKYIKVFERDDDVLEEIFSRIPKPSLSNENLIKYGVTNEDDLEFFKKLNAYRDEIFSQDVKFYERPTVSEVFVKLLTDITGYINRDLVENHESVLRNLSMVTHSIGNFEQMRYERDIRGAFWFLLRSLKSSDKFLPDKDSVQIMTVHKSKGLEFPVVILGSLKDNSFPKKFRNPNPSSGWDKGFVYYTPDDCLKYDKNESEEKHMDEEERIIYVAMTRAEDTIIFSTLVGEDGASKSVQCLEGIIDKHDDYFEHIDISDIDITLDSYEEKEDKDDDWFVNLSFTSLENYLGCPFRYKMSEEIGFASTHKVEIDAGIFVHRALEIINKKIKANSDEYIGDGEVTDIVSGLFIKANQVMKEEEPEKYDETLTSITNDVIYYYKNYGKDIRILESEYEVYLKKNHYALSGIIDLLYESDGRLGILDYKNTKKENFLKDKYKKQLNMYLFALKDQFMNRPIEELKVYALKSKNMMDIEIDEELIRELESKLDEVALKIHNGEFEPNYDCGDCEFCPYAGICGKKDN